MQRCSETTLLEGLVLPAGWREVLARAVVNAEPGWNSDGAAVQRGARLVLALLRTTLSPMSLSPSGVLLAPSPTASAVQPLSQHVSGAACICNASRLSSQAQLAPGRARQRQTRRPAWASTTGTPPGCTRHSWNTRGAGDAEHAQYADGQLRLCHVWAHLQVQGRAVPGPGAQSEQAITNSGESLTTACVL
jgi:hypothetical protein